MVRSPPGGQPPIPLLPKLVNLNELRRMGDFHLIDASDVCGFWRIQSDFHRTSAMRIPPRSYRSADSRRRTQGESIFCTRRKETKRAYCPRTNERTLEEISESRFIYMFAKNQRSPMAAYWRPRLSDNRRRRAYEARYNLRTGRSTNPCGIALASGFRSARSGRQYAISVDCASPILAAATTTLCSRARFSLRFSH